MNIKKHIPNFITCLNLASGCLGIAFATSNHLVWAAYMIGIAAVFDFLDGMFARLLNVRSEIGKQLDSLCDMVSFGVLPGFILFGILKLGIDPRIEFREFIPYVAFLIPIFSALRLAKFNIDERQTDSFIGLPTPANAILIGALPLIINIQIKSDPTLYHALLNALLNTNFLIVLTFVMSYLLIAEIPLFSMKVKSLKFKGNEYRYILIFIAILLSIFLKFIAIPLIIIFYIILSIINNLQKK
ncbi:MAG: CDP-diacylglycerol--serine O-phosphatidyltransferase [Bacteroidetes bacterium]|nr:CDP-diacylglycerol--serine O-phosphatidyltransferase [Bacteroidota bacterium]